ncbi:ATP-binding cassette domain-containing protein [Luteibacter yeojuensis]|uniref:ABC transporter ATP-binding protein n=1 Tax=Luteibacter yeojuensis TaxID=345309 RepID=A0A7X5QV87_9GAMM|nr:ABC transporter ATP-binding protein [Luteibacter yeojuensis]NID15927.1 ABC transporter ATP-binding protein [Luteibacter yeojuensis]
MAAGPDVRTPPPLRALLDTLPRGDRPKIAIYVALSLGSALAGSVAALLLVPLVQPAHGLSLPRFLLPAPDSDAPAAIFALATAVFALLRWQASRLGARLTAGYGLALRRRVQARLVDAPLPALADATSAEIANVLTHNAEIAVQGFSALQQLLVAGSTATVNLALAFWVSPPLMLAVPVFAVAGLLASRAFGREQAEVGRAYVAGMTRLFWHSEDLPRRLRHVRSFGREASEKASYGEVAAGLAHGYARQLELIASGRLVLELVSAAGIAGLFMLARRWHGIDTASLVAVCLLLGRLLPYVATTRQSFQQLRSAVPAIELWRRYMGLATPRRAASGAAELPGAVPVHIERMLVRPPVRGIEVADLELIPGELTLVCGDSGIGKTSLVDVLAGMAPPEAFSARAGRASLGFEAYRALVSKGAYVSQGVRLWQHTVRECLAWAAPDADDATLREALADVGLDRRLDDSAEGLDTALADASSRLSGGELQRLLLAQVILRRPRLAVLDEATSALDAASELNVLAALKRRLPSTILLVVSHRPGVAVLADQSIAIDSDRATVSRRPVTTPV